MTSLRVRFSVAIALLALVLIAAIAASRGPSALSDTAPADVFSAGRARQVLQRLVGEGIPHPVGSRQNAIVRDRVIAEFRALGYTPVVERDLACSPYGSCAWVENVLATLPGRETAGTVILNAHYDSVPAGPGAGDDATGVAAILEVARAMRTLPPPRHPVLFLIDDGEEAGLLGAEAFVGRHRAADFSAALVFEARGSSGRTLMFETSPGNRPLIDAYAESVPRPSTSSVYFSIYERLPNATNFTTFKREGFKGLAAAFIGDPAQYHTPLNRLENVPDGTLQHMGDTALGVTREIADDGLRAEQGNASYYDVFTLAVVRWPEAFNLPAAVLALLSLCVLAGLQLHAGRFGGRALVWSLALGLLPLFLAGLAGYAISSLIAPHLDHAYWPASEGWLTLAAWMCGFAAVALCAAWARGKIRGAVAWTAVWIDASVLGITVAFLLPGATYLFVVPALAAVLIGGATWIRRKTCDSPLAVVVPLVLMSALVFPFALELIEGMGANTLFGVAILIAMASTPLLPILVELASPLRIAAFPLAGMLVAIGAVFVAPVYTPEIPRPLTFVYHMDGGAAGAHWIAEMPGDAMPAALQKTASWRDVAMPTLSIGRSDASNLNTSADASPVSLAFPEARIVSVEQRGNRSLLHVEIRSPRGAQVMRLRFGVKFDPRLVSVGDLTLKGESRTTGTIVIHTVPPEGITVGVEVDSAAEGSDFAVDDESSGLPASGAPLLMARGADSVPIHRGDRTLLTTLGRVPPLRSN